MFIKDLQPRQTNVDVEGEVLELSDVREFNKYGKQGKVATALIKDGTGKVKLSLWNEQIEKVHPGDTVKIQNGYVSEFQGELQLTTGKFGTLEVTSGEGPKPEPEPQPEPEPEPTPEPEPEQAPTEETKKQENVPEENLDVEEEDLT
jgi:replication factor A1